MIRRIIAILALLVSACTLPWGITLVLGVACVIYFDSFYEVIPVFFIHDSLFGVGEHRYFMIQYMMTIVACILVLCSTYLRKRLFSVQARHI